MILGNQVLAIVNKKKTGNESENLVCDRTIRRVMNRDPDTGLKTVSSEAVALLSKATELFMLQFVSDVSKQKNNEILYDDVAEIVSANPSYEFLTELLPFTPDYRAKQEAASSGKKKQKT